MIRIERKARPAALDKTPTRGKNKGKTESQQVEAALEAHLKSGQPRDAFSFDYKRYKEPDVKHELEAAFAGKCAYCETFYSASQPMDVEHWRPKGEVHRDGADPIKPGYYWLASDWDNLFPSCIDCNRARQQWDVLEQKLTLRGKANQFPLADEDTRILSHQGDPDMSAETTLLIDPCTENPEDFFAYTEDGAIVPREGLPPADRDRALASVKVYALNRSALVMERHEVVQRLDQRLKLIDALTGLRRRLEKRRDDDLAEVVAELIATEARALEEMTDAGSPFAGAVRFFLRE